MLQAFNNEEGFSKVVDIDDILNDFDGNLNISFYVKTQNIKAEDFKKIYSNWLEHSDSLKINIERLLNGN